MSRKCLICDIKINSCGWGWFYYYCGPCRGKGSKYKRIDKFLENRKKKLEVINELIHNLEVRKAHIKMQIERTQEEFDKLLWHKAAMITAKFDQETRLFTISIFQKGICIETRTLKAWEKRAFSSGIGSINEKPSTIPWKKLFEGEEWTAKVTLSDWYLEKRLLKDGVYPDKVLNIDAYRTPHIH